MLEGLSNSLKKCIDVFTKSSADKSALEELIKEIQRALITADVDVHLVFELKERILKNSDKQPVGLTKKEHIIKLVYDEITSIMGKEAARIELKPKKILLVGLYGSGKTTTSAKLALFYKKHGLKTALIGCDTVRPAAYEQLEQLAKKIDVQFYGESGHKKPAVEILRSALNIIKADIYIVDSSGRNALDDDLIKEIKDIDAVLKPDERILVLPADIGQAAKPQSTAFHQALNITDIIITKLDATARGGGALTACYSTGAKVRFITTGETPDDIEQYDSKKLVSRLLGFPDLETLLEKARGVVDEKKAEKIIKGDFDLEDFYSQIEGMQKMGPLSSILDMAGLGKFSEKLPKDQEEKMKRWKYVMQSMTKVEKAFPEKINSARVQRIAKGSGCTENDVRELLSHYNKIKKLTKMISPSKMKRGEMGRMMSKFGFKM